MDKGHDQHRCIKMKGLLSLLLVVGVVALLGGVYLLTGGQFNSPFAAVSYSDFGSCQVVEPRSYYLECTGVGDPISKVFNGSFSGTAFKVETIGSYVETARAFRARLNIEGTGALVCQIDPNNPYACDGKQLSKGQSYKWTILETQFLVNEKDYKITVKGQVLKISLTSTTTGFATTLPGTDNCQVQNFNDAIKQTSVADDVSASNNWGSVTMTENEKRSNFLGWQAVTNALPSYNYNGNAAVCDIEKKKIIGFTKGSAVDGSCVAIQDSSNILFDGAGKNFCCNANDCRLYGMSSNAGCVNNVCQDSSTNQVPSTGGTADACVTNDQCGPSQYVTNTDSKSYYIQNLCISQKCVQTREEIACNPLSSYPNNQCCGRNALTDKWELGTCKASLTTCETLGATACCMETQSKYTLKPAPSGKYCCDIDKDGVGSVTSSQGTCFEEGTSTTGINLNVGNPFGFLGDILGGIGDFLGDLGGWIFWIIVLIIVILFLLIVIKILGWLG